MLRLSIIVPHHHDDSKLEATLLSLLENRESHHEIIVVHTGNYEDPYDLGADEVIMLQAPKQFTEMEQINLAISSSCAAYVQVLFPGCVVDKGWSDEALATISMSQAAAIGVPININESQSVHFGLDPQSLPHRRYLHKRSRSALPSLCGSIFYKKKLKQLGGFFSRLPREGAELELALLLGAMELETIAPVTIEARIHAPRKSVEGMDAGYEIGRMSGILACAYGAVEGSGVCVDSLAKQLGHLAGGLMSPKTVAERLGWVMGIRDHSLESEVRERLLTAADRLDAAVEEERRQPMMQQRRAA